MTISGRIKGGHYLREENTSTIIESQKSQKCLNQGTAMHKLLRNMMIATRRKSLES